MKAKSFVGILLFVLTSSCWAIGPNPSHDWRSFDSDHFVVHYEAKNRAQAEAAVTIAETVWPRITGAFQWQPQEKTQLILMDDFDVANGFATPLPFNHTGIFLTPPDDGELLENSDWLELVISHELTHIVHMDKRRGAPKALQNVLGRFPLLFPNVWQPTWLIEGLATYVESEPDAHRGRLDNTLFDAYMRLEVQSGVKSLREINSDGRAFPINKAYLYGAYFYRFLEQRYGDQAVYRMVNDYSDNLLPFRVHSNPVTVTGKAMDALWLEYQDWLRARFAGPQVAQSGALLIDTQWQLAAPALAVDGSVYAVVNDGIRQPQLQRVLANGQRQTLVRVENGARIDVNQRGEVLIAQPEICANYHYYYDLYRWSEADGKQRLSHCGRYRNAVWLGDHGMVALHNDSGQSELQLLDRTGQFQRRLYRAAAGEELPDFAVNATGSLLVWTSKQAGQWRLQEMDLSDQTAPVRTLWHSDTPLLSPHYRADDQAVLFGHDRDDRLNAWQVARDGSGASRLTEVNGAVLALTGSDEQQQFVTLELVSGGYQMRRHSLAAETVANTDPVAAGDIAPTSPTTQATQTTSTTQDSTVAAATAQPIAVTIRNERDYSALETIAPRAWFPTAFVGDGALALGVEVFGQDALGWHQYTFSPQYETSEGEWLGSFIYGYDQRHFLAAFREMEVTSSSENDDDEEEIVAYKLRTTTQWVSLLPWLRLDTRIYSGIGIASARETYQIVDGAKFELQDERVAAAFIGYDSRRGNWWSEGNNRGQMLSLLAESYDPFDGQYEGKVYRADWRGQFGLGATTLALRYTEARGDDGTEPFELGGHYNSEHVGIPRLNERDLALRGYDNGEPALTGKRARIGGVEWRTPLADLDTHFMVPPIGFNRLSAALFYEAGAAWSGSSSPEQYYRSAGLELLAELKLGYRIGLQITLGWARGLDEPGGDEAYFRLGRSF
ncbi:hypothetical protein HPT27_01390 [Permianibacter sp. IMCC34836]|uniref:hypothetical protein n=1 Tax=Permianibacter fluminis TaxID=2738515 RepID=UPI00155702A2|nr:hypothetical protein [Permianibacter fluminis]NQD35656.1 hypothetical protein [Permianibacter fluminis]